MKKKGFERVFFLCSSLASATITVAACSADAGTSPGGGGSALTAMCEEFQTQVFSAATRDGIPALTDPELVTPDSPWVEYLLPTDRVIGLEIDGQFLAVPHNILWWHEIVNFNDLGLAVTYCPLTGSSMVFRRDVVQGAEFGVSGLLFKNNLVMFDRAAVGGEDSLWPQMLAGAYCGPEEGNQLSMLPAIEIEWEDWQALHPDTRVVSSRTGRGRDYTRYPYGSYEVEDNELTLIPLERLDGRRPPKERVLGIPFASGGGIAFPFGALREVGDLAVVHTVRAVVFWDSQAVAAMAFQPSVLNLTFEVREGAFVDMETGSQWSIEGRALSGPMQGERLSVIAEAYVSFWFAYSQFFPASSLWLP